MLSITIKRLYNYKKLLYICCKIAAYIYSSFLLTKRLKFKCNRFIIKEIEKQKARQGVKV